MKAVLYLIGFICVQLVCGQDDPDLECTEGSEWNDGCNDCWCDPRGFISCTKKACNDDNQSVGSCKNGSRWLQDNCNWCSCNDGQAACTERYCPPDTVPDHGHAVSPDPTRPQVQDRPGGRGKQLSPGTPSDSGSCKAGTRYFDGCNWCTCTSTGVAACTLKACFDSHPRQVRSALADSPPPDHECHGDETWKEDCNTCRCRNGLKTCTKRLCPPKRPTRSVNHDRCLLPKESGLCFASIQAFWFNADTKDCEEFVYGGCGGNANRFASIEDCQKACRKH